MCTARQFLLVVQYCWIRQIIHKNYRFTKPLRSVEQRGDGDKVSVCRGNEIFTIGKHDSTYATAIQTK